MVRVPVCLVFLAAAAAAQGRGATRGVPPIDLDSGWRIQSSAKAAAGGAEISQAGFDDSGWYPASVPSTVISTLVDNGALPDPYFGMNLRSFPGQTGDIGDNLTNLPMPPDSPFAVSWWYRKRFWLPGGVPVRRGSTKGAFGGRKLWLNFDSINYRANIWVNGRQVATSDQVRGMYRMFERDITDAARPGANTLAVEVFPPTETDFTITFVDWNPLPPDKDMGLARDVYLRTSGPVTVRHPQVVSQVEPTLEMAHLTVYADVANNTGAAVEGTLAGTVAGIPAAQAVQLAAGETARVAMNIDLANPPLWWPYGLGPQNLEDLHLEFATAAGISDSADARFGIREVTSQLDAQQHRVFFVNGRRILIRGAAFTHDMMLRQDPEREEYEMRYARDMHLNTLRLEGKMLDEHFFDLADEYGMLVMPGWCCCAYWEWPEKWQPGDFTIVGESLRDQVRRLRNHPSVFVFLYGSDAAVNGHAEQVYLNVLREENWPNPCLASASDDTTPGAGRTGVKMRGPYAWVGPGYWYQDTDRGGAFGFATEISPGHAIPLVESLKQMLPPEHLWPIDQFWVYHEATPTYPNLDEYNAALAARYGAPEDLEDYVRKAQLMAYESERAMFEAYGRNKYASTGVIQWLMNNAWPSIVWHLYDWYLRPGGGYFGTKKACEPLHIQYSYDDGSIVVVNSLYQAYAGYRATAEVHNLDLTRKFAQTGTVDIGEDGVTRVFSLPRIDGLSSTYFVRLALDDPAGNRVSSNFYWLSTQAEQYAWNASDAWHTPVTTYADLTELAQLPPAQVAASWRSETSGADEIDHVTVRNSSAQLAFFVHLTVRKGKDGGDVAPAYWDDNYFSLMPGESREVTVTYPRKLLGGAAAGIQVDGWNVAK